MSCHWLTDTAVFVADPNRDGAFSVADLWFWGSRLANAPGNAIVDALCTRAPGIARFLELQDPSFATWVSVAVSVLAWTIGVGAIRFALRS